VTLYTGVSVCSYCSDSNVQSMSCTTVMLCLQDEQTQHTFTDVHGIRCLPVDKVNNIEFDYFVNNFVESSCNFTSKCDVGEYQC
jgi:hypothetical protein